MGLRRTWVWDKIDWDEEIYLDKVVFYESDVLSMNATELVEILNLRGIRAHRGLGLHQLRELLFRSLRGEDPEVDHPMDFLRRRISWFIKTFQSKIKDQLVEDCNCRCMENPDAEVLMCYMASKGTIERKIEEHGYKD